MGDFYIKVTLLIVNGGVIYFIEFEVKLPLFFKKAVPGN